jgi:hypothetical protein
MGAHVNILSPCRIRVWYLKENARLKIVKIGCLKRNEGPVFDHRTLGNTKKTSSIHPLHVAVVLWWEVLAGAGNVVMRLEHTKNSSDNHRAGYR